MLQGRGHFDGSGARALKAGSVGLRSHISSLPVRRLVCRKAEAIANASTAVGSYF